MKRYALGVVALAPVSFAASASAADLAVQAPVYTKAPVAAPFTWAGAYIGASVGGVWANDRITDLDDLISPQTYNLKSSGVIGSGVVGYNWQFSQLVFGGEVDLGGIGWSKTIPEPGTNNCLVPNECTSNHLGNGLYGDVTARVGFAAGKALFYAKGGWAFFDGTASVVNEATPTATTTVTAITRNFTSGWTAGAGIEYAFAPAWSAKIEYQHFDFGTQTATFQGNVNVNFATLRYPNDLTADAVKVGVNYHFH
jgi:outer membrane immunogenic protein